MKYYIVRHGETLFNIKHVCQGWCDSPLTPKGINQAKECSKLLKDIPFEHVYVSTSERAVDTMFNLIDDRQLPITYSKSLKEKNFGDMEGEKFEAFPKGDVVNDDFILSHGGESDEMAFERFYTFLNETAVKHTGNVLIVTHGALIKILLERLAPEIIEDLRQKNEFIGNCAITEIEYTNKLTVLGLSNNQHQRDK